MKLLNIENKIIKLVKKYDWATISYTIVGIWTGVTFANLPTKEIWDYEVNSNVQSLTITHILLAIVFIFCLLKVLKKYEEIK